MPPIHNLDVVANRAVTPLGECVKPAGAANEPARDKVRMGLVACDVPNEEPTYSVPPHRATQNAVLPSFRVPICFKNRLLPCGILSYEKEWLVVSIVAVEPALS